MTIKSDRWIKSQQGMIEPFVPELRRHKEEGLGKAISYGLSSFGYDIRCAPEFKVFSSAWGGIADPRCFDEGTSCVELTGDYCIVPPNGFVLTRSVEKLKIPRNVMAIVLGKSTYARCGLHCLTTPLEPCLSEDSEILSNKGWVPMADIKVGDMVLTRRLDGVAEYQPVERKQEREFHGEMIHFAGRSVDQLVTPDHKVFGRVRTSSISYREGTFEAKSVYGKHGYSFDREVSWHGDEHAEEVNINGQTFSLDSFLVFLGCWLGDGSAYLGNDGGYSIKLAVVSKEEKRNFFRKVLSDLGVSAREHESGFRFYSKPLATYLMQFGHAREKFIDRKFLSLKKEKLELLMSGLMASDGCKLTNAYTTTSKRLADDVQELAFKIGKAAIVRKVRNCINGRGFDAFVVRIVSEHMTPKIPPSAHRKVEYSGMVYDVTVPNHVFFCRRDGKASWTGNCWEGYITLEFANTSPIPAILYANEGCAQVLFFESDEDCEVSYADRKGKYQNQVGIVLPKL
jgi:dCTP deaminase